VTAAKVNATLRHIQRRWPAVSPATASTTPRKVKTGHSSASRAKPMPLAAPPCAWNASDSPDGAPIRIAATYNHPAVRCSAGRRRRTPVLSCNGASSSASPAKNMCSGTSHPEIANFAASGLPTALLR